MKTKFFVLVSALSVASLAYAKEPMLGQKGTLLEMEAVACGTEQKTAGGGLKGAILGNDPNHTKQEQLLCQEYVLQTDTMEYRIRNLDEKHPVLLPVGDTAEFTVKKNYLMLRTRELDRKIRKFSVMSITQREQQAPAHKETAKALQ